MSNKLASFPARLGKQAIRLDVYMGCVRWKTVPPINKGRLALTILTLGAAALFMPLRTGRVDVGMIASQDIVGVKRELLGEYWAPVIVSTEYETTVFHIHWPDAKIVEAILKLAAGRAPVA